MRSKVMINSRKNSIYNTIPLSGIARASSVLCIVLCLLFSCSEPLMDTDVSTATPVVESYLHEGSNSLTVRVYTVEEYVKDDVILSRPVGQLNMSVNNIALTETSSGTYFLDLEEDVITEGQTYTLQFDYNGKSIEAATTIPSPVSTLAVEPQTLHISSISFWDFSDTTQVLISWDDIDNGYYQVYIDSPNNPDIPSMDFFKRRMMQPTKGNSYKVSRRQFRSTGTHTIYVYKVSKEYAELYERISASDLANPVSYIQNAFGIFTSISVARVSITVYE